MTTLPPKIQEEITALIAQFSGTTFSDAAGPLTYLKVALEHIATLAIEERDKEDEMTLSEVDALINKLSGVSVAQMGEVATPQNQSKEQQKVRCEHDWQNVTTDEYGYRICKTCGEQTDLY